MVPGAHGRWVGVTGRCWGRGSPNTCFSPRDEGAFAGAAVAGAGRAPGSSCWGFPGSGLTWDGAAWPLPWPAGCKTQLYATTLTHAAAGLPGHPAARLCALPGWERAGGGDQAVPRGCPLSGSGWSQSCTSQDAARTPDLQVPSLLRVLSVLSPKALPPSPAAAGAEPACRPALGGGCRRCSDAAPQHGIHRPNPQRDCTVTASESQA